MTSKHLRIPVLVLLTLAAHFTLNAQQQQANDDKPDDRRTGSLTGKVVNENGQPVTNAAVMVRAVAGGFSRATTTSSDGTFSINGLDPTLYFVFASSPSYVLQSYNPSNFYRPGDSVKLDLVKGGVITGTVTSSTGEPVIGIRVRAYLIRDAEGRSKPTTAVFANERTTDDRGIYRIYGLPAGTYLVASAGPSYGYPGSAYDADLPTFAPSSTRDTASEFVVRAGEETTNVDIRHRGETGHEVSGTASGSVAPGPYSQFTVTLMPLVPGMPPATSFQPGGTRGFSFSGVADGTYEVRAQSSSGTESAVSDAVRITVKGADVTSIELITKPLGSISGRLLLEPSQEPECKGKRNPLLSETLIVPLRSQENSNEQFSLIRYLIGPTLPDNEGAFTFRNVPAMRYGFDVKLFAKYWYLQSITLPSAAGPVTTDKSSRLVDVARNWLNIKHGERVSNLTITVAGGAASIRGSLEAEGQEKTPPRLYLNLVPAEREKSDDVLRFFAAPIAEDGGFTLGNLPPGRYRLLVQPVAENETQWQAKIRRPEESELRAKLRREAESLKTEIELKPCQNVVGYKVKG